MNNGMTNGGFGDSAIKHWPMLTAVAVLAVVLLWMLGLLGGGKVAPGRHELAGGQQKDSATAVVEQRVVPDMMAWPGSVRARSEAQIAPKVTARIVAIKVRAGDKVKQGDLLALLDSDALDAERRTAAAGVAAAQAEAERARADERRARNLYAKEAATREALDQAVAQARATQARAQAASGALQQSAIQRGEAELRAPFEGVVVARLKEPGDMGLAGLPLLTLQQTQGLRLEVALPVHCAGQIGLGDSVPVRIENLPETLAARIDEIVPEVDEQSRTILLKATLQETPGLQPGLFGWMQQACGEHTALLLPERAIRRIGQLEIVKLLHEGQVLTRHVRTGKRQDDRVEILAGLDVGDRVVLP